MTSFPERQWVVSIIDEAVTQGARKEMACETIELSIRTLQRWSVSGAVKGDQRNNVRIHAPKNKLSDKEREKILQICNEAEFSHLAPSQIVPILLDRGIYIASESTFYRVLKQANQLRHRGKARPKSKVVKPTSFTAKKANQVWCWDITYCPSRVIGQYYYLYMIEDVYSRKIVGWEVHERESGEYAANLLERSVWAEKCYKNKLVLHSDNGSPMKSLTMQSKMYDLGVAGSRSRPRVSNDNPYSESLFRTVKYHPRWPSEGFESLEKARAWVKFFVEWYNNEHRHSRIKFVTPVQRHNGDDIEILKRREKLYHEKKTQNPQRWAANTRNWEHIKEVELNPEQNKQAA